VTLYRLPEPLRAVAFDIDNTLYEHPAYAGMQQRVLIEALGEGLGVSPEDAAQRVETHRTRHAADHGGRRPSLAATSLAFGFDISTSIQWRLDRIHPEEYLEPDQRLHAALERLGRSFTIAAITNNPVAVGRRTLRTLGVESLFTAVVGLDTGRASKPDPLPFRVLADTLDIPLTETLVVGDRYAVDLEPALELGGGAVLVEGIRDTYALCELLAL
jgi:phosphoglycolate phosphatase